MIKCRNWAPDTLNTGLRDHVMDETAKLVCVLYYRGRLGTTVNYKFIVFFENHAYPMPLPGHTQHTPFRHARYAPLGSYPSEQRNTATVATPFSPDFNIGGLCCF